MGGLTAGSAATLRSSRSDGAVPAVLKEVLTTVAGRGGPPCGIVTAAGLRAGSDAFATRMEALQARVREGPGHQVLATGTAVSATHDLLCRWPIFAVTARRHGLRGVHAEPLPGPGGTTLGAISWYSTRPAGPCEPWRQQLRSAALHAAALISSRSPAPRGSAWAEEATAQAVLVARAVDLLMAHNLCGPDEAFALLRDIAADNHTTIETHAAVLVDRATRAGVRASPVAADIPAMDVLGPDRLVGKSVGRAAQDRADRWAARRLDDHPKRLRNGP